MKNEETEILINNKYVYLSFNPKDYDIVIKYAQGMKERGINYWFDDTKDEPTQESIDIKAERLKNSETVIFFISKDFIESTLNKGEVTFAQNRKKVCTVIFLNDKTFLDDGLEMQLGHVQAFYPYRRNSLDDAIDEVLSNEVFNSCNKNNPSELLYTGYHEDEKTRKRNDKNAKYNNILVKWGIYISCPFLVLFYYLLIILNGWSILGCIICLITTNITFFVSVLYRLLVFRKNQKASAKKIKPLLLAPIIVVFVNLLIVSIMLYIKFYLL